MQTPRRHDPCLRGSLLTDGLPSLAEQGGRLLHPRDGEVPGEADSVLEDDFLPGACGDGDVPGQDTGLVGVGGVACGCLPVVEGYSDPVIRGDRDPVLELDCGLVLHLILEGGDEPVVDLGESPLRVDDAVDPFALRLEAVVGPEGE